MKRTLVGVLAGSLIFAGAATAASPTAKKIAALQRDVKALKATVNKQKKTINALGLEVALNYVGDACSLAAISDAFQGTWATVDQFAGHSLFGAQTAISDRGSCAVPANPDIRREGIKKPPTVSVFDTIEHWLIQNPISRFVGMLWGRHR